MAQSALSIVGADASGRGSLRPGFAGRTKVCPSGAPAQAPPSGDDSASRLRLERRPMSTSPIALALYEPDIAANAGAMMRTCACLGVDAAIIEPAGFLISDRRFRRSAMDYLDQLVIGRHASFERFETWRAASGRRLVLLTTKGDSQLWEFVFRPGDILMVGRESAGVPDAVAAVADARVRIPIRPSLRSLNVGIAAALALGEALRQLRPFHDFAVK
jgi:tRNA (cytidine/uridine-2'-O-)-methyltransferase